MSKYAPVSRLPLFADAPEREKVRRVHEDMETRNRRWLSRARDGLARQYERVRRPLSTDDLWRLIDNGDVPPIPPDASSNLLGTVFSGGNWIGKDFIRSEREGSHGNLIRRWVPGEAA